MVTLKEWAEKLNGREYGNEINYIEAEALKALGFVIVYGAADDLCEFVGAINEEVGCYEGGTIYLTAKGLFENQCEDDDCPYAAKEREKCQKIKVLWNPDNLPFGEVSWIYETAIPHETFDIVEYERAYCRGIIFDIKSLK